MVTEMNFFIIVHMLGLRANFLFFNSFCLFQSIQNKRQVTSEMKTLEWYILNPDRLINLEINNKRLEIREKEWIKSYSWYPPFKSSQLWLYCILINNCLKSKCSDRNPTIQKGAIKHFNGLWPNLYPELVKRRYLAFPESRPCT